MPQQIGWSVEAKLLYEIKQLTKQLSGREYIAVYANFAAFPIPGITGTLYVDQATGDIYVWNGTSYVLLSAGITALNGLIAAAQLLVTGSTGTDFNISSAGTTHTFNIPTASAANRGLLSSTDWSTFNSKIGGTGTTNYVSKFTGAGTLGNSQIFDNGTNVGIGTTSPVVTLDVRGEVAIAYNASYGLRFYNDARNNWSSIGNTITGSTDSNLVFKSASGVMTYTGLGRLIIGSAADTSELLQVNGTMRTANGAYFATASGAVGIGTTSVNAGRKLQINGDSTDSFIQLVTTTSGTTASDGFVIGVGNGTEAFLLNYENSPLKIFTAGNERMRITGTGDVGIGTATTTAKVTIATADATSTTRNALQITDETQASLLVSLGNNLVNLVAGGNDALTLGTNSAERMRIDSSGNVGIGTTAASVYAGFTTLSLNNATNGGLLAFQVNGTNNAYIYSTASQATIATLTSIPLTFVTNNSEKMRITSGGDVGIGTNNPATFAGLTGLTVTGTNGSFIRLQQGANYTSEFSADANRTYLIELRNLPMSFYTNNLERLRITSGGNVLIGTTTDPGYKVNVNGVTNTLALYVDEIRSLASSGNISFKDNSGTVIGSIDGSTRIFNWSLGNFGIAQTTFGTSATRTLAISTGVAPTTSPVDAIQMYSADVVAGNAAPHFRTENGAVVKVYQETTAVGAATFVQGSVNAVYEDSTFDGYTLKQIVKALRNQGLLA